jgi:hypothetical protein
MPELVNCMEQKAGSQRREGEIYTKKGEVKKYKNREGVLIRQGNWGSRSYNVFYKELIKRVMRKG